MCFITVYCIATLTKTVQKCHVIKNYIPPVFGAIRAVKLLYSS